MARALYNLCKKNGTVMEYSITGSEFAEMPRNVQLAYIASERLANDYPIESSDRLAKVYIKTT